jgi:hypothetical protein
MALVLPVLVVAETVMPMTAVMVAIVRKDRRGDHQGGGGEDQFLRHCGLLWVICNVASISRGTFLAVNRESATSVTAC